MFIDKLKMKIEKLEVKNFRAIYDLSIEFGRVTVLIGKNSSGKSSILNAIQVIFENLDIIKDGPIKINIDRVEERLRRQIENLWFYTYQSRPIKLAVLMNFDKEERNILKDSSGLESVEKAYIEVSIEKSDKQVIFKLQKIEIYGYATETTKIAEEALKGMMRIHSELVKHNNNLKSESSIPSIRHIIVENGIVRNKELLESFLNVINDKVHYINPFYGILDPYSKENILNRIRGFFIQSITPPKLIEFIKDVIKDVGRRMILSDYLKQIRGYECEYEQPDKSEILTKLYEKISLNYELLGSGDQIIEGLLASIIFKGKYHVFLIEEPEAHLHPTYVKRLTYVLESLAKNLDVQLIIVTHSPDFIASLKDKSFVIGVRKEMIKAEFGDYQKEVPATTIFYPFRDNSESLARELGIVPGYFLFSDVVILVEGNSDKILLERYIDKLIEKGKLKNLPKYNYSIIPFRQRNLRDLIKIFKDYYKLRVFVIADNDQEGHNAIKIAKSMGLHEDHEAFVTNKKDILCYVEPEELVKALEESLKELFDKHYDDIMQRDEVRSLIDEIRQHGACKNGVDLLNKLSGVLHEILKDSNDNIKGSEIKLNLKRKIAERVELIEVPDDISRIIINIDRELEEVYGKV